MPADMPSIEELARRHGLALLEDAAQAHAASIDGRRVGTFGTSAFSFFATKNMTTLEGGMVLTSDADVARRMRLLRNHGRDGRAAHLLVGGNFRMNEIAAAIGRVQLRQLEHRTARRRAAARFFNARLEGVVTPADIAGREPVFHQYTIRVAQHVREGLISSLDAQGIDARVYYERPIHEEPAFADLLRGRLPHLPETERACRTVLSLPVHPDLNERDLERIVRAVNAFSSRA